jgi:drug/metabolite transporter (DMT)-like permease
MTEARFRLILPLSLLIAILAVSTASIFIRFAQTDGAPSLVIAALRLTFATLLLAPLALTRHRAELQSLTRKQITLGVVSGYSSPSILGHGSPRSNTRPWQVRWFSCQRVRCGWRCCRQCS